MSQSWALSQTANKSKGTCSVCFATRQVKHKDGTIHRHGPRDNPCPGSDKPPLHGAYSVTLSQPIDSAGVDASTIEQINQGKSPSVSHCVVQAAEPDQINSMPDWAISNHPCIKHIPKSARATCASHLAGLLRRIVSNPNDVTAWRSVLCWSSSVLPVPKRGGKRHNITSVIKKRVSEFSDDPNVAQTPILERRPFNRFDLANAISAKLEEGNVKAAVRLLCSDETPAMPSLESLAKLQDKHPPAATDRLQLPQPESFPSLIVGESDVLNAVRSFPAGSSGGPDGFRPQHLVDLVNCPEASSELISALTAFVNLVLSGHCHPAITPVLFGGRLIALNKKSGGIRPIAVGFTLRRLIAKCASRFAAQKLEGYFPPRQLGFGSPGGCEAAVHAVRRFIASIAFRFRGCKTGLL